MKTDKYKNGLSNATNNIIDKIKKELSELNEIKEYKSIEHKFVTKGKITQCKKLLSILNAKKKRIQTHL